MFDDEDDLFDDFDFGEDNRPESEKPTFKQLCIATLVVGAIAAIAMYFADQAKQVPEDGKTPEAEKMPTPHSSKFSAPAKDWAGQVAITQTDIYVGRG